MKINFKQPKYVIPLIILPFVVFGFFIFGGKNKAGENNIGNEKVEGLNTNMPGVDSSISKGEIKDKFQAYQQAFKNVTDQSAMNDIDKSGPGSPGVDYESSYSFADKQRLEAQRKMDSLNEILHLGQSRIQKQITQYNNGGEFGEIKKPQMKNNTGKSFANENNESDDHLLQDLLKREKQDNSSQSSQSGGDEDPGSYESQMRVFRQQMKYMDSLQHANGGNMAATKNNDLKSKPYRKNFQPGDDTSFKPLPISSESPERENEFNTVRNFNEKGDNITAMIDQDIKATLGSRVRIRLLKDMYAGQYLIKRGSYIYGVVTGFQKQRVNISIAQILYNNTSLPVKIDLFDNDGYLGLYVPGSNFREFSKEIGTQGTQGLSQAVTPDNSDVKTNMLSQLFNTTTTTLSSLIKKDKAFLKYNYIVYLKENKSSSND